MKYTAINIGPILSTFSMVRKPRELWAASYMFSYLMKFIIEELAKSGYEIISPAKLSPEADKTIGLYPDRVFVKGEVEQKLLDAAFKAFAKELGLDSEKVKPYFNLMAVSIKPSEQTEDHVMRLNRLLDRMELCNLNFKNEKTEIARETIFNYLRGSLKSLKEITGKGFKNRSLETIASYDIFDGEADKSDKYICIVQADGDNMGKVVSALPEPLIASLSNKLLNFGEECCKTIKDYGGLPIYAGGDDLLFLAPVLTSDGSIFDLIEKLDNHYENVQKYVDGKLQGKFHTTMSYGISMTYHKYPLYEALAKARESLFVTAKNVEGKNAVAWVLQKHSGSSFNVAMSKSMNNLYGALKKVIAATENNQLVSAVSHKIRHNEVLLSLWLDGVDDNIKGQRINNFFDKIIDVEGKDANAISYMEAVKDLLLAVYQNADNLSSEENRLKKMKELTTIVYGMLRTAKFVKGKEEDK